MLSDIKRSAAQAQKAQQAHTIKVDQRIKGSLMDGSERAVDNRAEKIQIEGSTAKWASK